MYRDNGAVDEHRLRIGTATEGWEQVLKEAAGWLVASGTEPTVKRRWPVMALAGKDPHVALVLAVVASSQALKPRARRQEVHVTAEFALLI